MKLDTYKSFTVLFGVELSFIKKVYKLRRFHCQTQCFAFLLSENIKCIYEGKQKNEMTLFWNGKKEGKALKQSPKPSYFCFFNIHPVYQSTEIHTDQVSRWYHCSNILKSKGQFFENYYLIPADGNRKGFLLQWFFHTSSLKSLNYFHANKKQNTKLFWICLSKDPSFKINCKMC